MRRRAIAAFMLFSAGLMVPILAAAPGALAAGIGFAQAEEGTWYCRGDDPVSALNCAREKCRAEGQGQDCYRVRWCYPARWSGLMVVWLADFHSTEIVCGASDQDEVRALLKVMCEKNPYAKRCGIFRMIDPEGRDIQIDEGEFPGGAKQ